LVEPEARIAARLRTLSSARHDGLSTMLQAASLAALPGIRHAFFTRDGGVSDGVYTSLNGGPGSKDAPASVAENRARMAAARGAPRARPPPAAPPPPRPPPRGPCPPPTPGPGAAPRARRRSPRDPPASPSGSPPPIAARSCWRTGRPA